MLAAARVRFEPEFVRWFRCGELVALEIDIRGCRRVLVAMFRCESCGEGGMKTAVAIQRLLLDRVDVFPNPSLSRCRALDRSVCTGGGIHDESEMSCLG